MYTSSSPYLILSSVSLVSHRLVKKMTEHVNAFAI